LSELTSFRPRAVVFDLDGTLVDNMPLHAESFIAFAARHGLPELTLDLRRRIDGKRNSEIFPLLFEREMTWEEILAYEEEKEGAYRELSVGKLAPLAGAIDLLDALESQGVPVAVATSAPAKNVAHTLRESGLEARLPVVARGDEVPQGKPFPDVFLKAAEKLGVAPEACLAFEDAPLGVEAAVRAGMRVVAVSSTFTEEQFLASTPAPHAVVRDYVHFLEGMGSWLRGGVTSPLRGFSAI
jgi:HAD superfamily hydrolase (TIGR01509 family)